MLSRYRHDLYALFAFALRENDWALADSIARWLLVHDRYRLERVAD